MRSAGDSSGALVSDNCCQLHCHSAYSFKDGLCQPEVLVRDAAAKGQEAMGLTDHGVMFGAPAFFKACDKHGIKGIIGMEIYEAVDYEIDPETIRDVFKAKWTPGMIRYYHLTLWAMNEVGWRNLCALHSLSFSGRGYKPKNQPLIDKVSLEQHSDGLLVGLGCPASRVNVALATAGYDSARTAAEWYAEVFEDRLYVEVMGNLDDQRHALREQRKLAAFLGRPTLATNDVHYLNQAQGVEHGPHHMLVQARKHKSSATKEESSDDQSDVSFGDWYGGDGFYMKNRQQMLESGLLTPEVDQTLELAARIDFEFKNESPAKPVARIPAPGGDPAFDEWLAAA